jgi:hypothetical protein
MRTSIALFVLLSTGLLTYAIADEPSAAAAPAAAATPAQSGAPPATTPAAAEPKATATLSDAAAVAQIHRLRSAGYKPETRNGEAQWCKQQTAIGSRLAQVKNCGTADQIEQAIQDAKDTVEKIQRDVTEHKST